MTTPMPATGEPVHVDPTPAAAVAGAPAEPDDRHSVRVLWWKTMTVLTLAFLATVAFLAWQWLGPASGTVTR